MGAAVGEEKNPAEEDNTLVEGEEETDLAEVEDPAGQATSSANTLDGKDVQLGCSEKTQVPVHAKEHLLVVEEEDDDSEKKVKKRKRSELQQIKQEKLFSDAQQSHLPCGAEENLLAAAEEEAESENVQLQEKKVKKKKRSDAVKGQVLVDVGEPSNKVTCPLRWRASFHTLVNRKYQKPKYKGSVLMYPEENRVTLK